MHGDILLTCRALVAQGGRATLLAGAARLEFFSAAAAVEAG